MGIKQIVSKIVSEYNPISNSHRNRMRKRLTNKDVTLLCPNCLGGILFHDLGLKFNSPTVNLMLTQKDFLQFVQNLDVYRKGTLTFFKDSELACPCAYLQVKNYPDVKITFTHYHNEQEAHLKWNERYTRIKKDNVFICLQERDGITYEDIKRLASLKVKGIVVFTAHRYDDIPYTVYMDKYKSDGEVGNILKKNHISGKREYEQYFDFVKWFNEADGRDYDVKPYIRKM